MHKLQPPTQAKSNVRYSRMPAQASNFMSFKVYQT